MSRRIGIMGGMFDPVHQGHLQVAKAALDALDLAQLYMVPCGVPGHRHEASAPAAQRLLMLQLALKEFNDSRLRADDRELHRPGVSYMVDTLASFATEFPDATLVYVMGWDSFNSLPSWHQWRRMFDYCHICAVSRPGVSLATGDFARQQPAELASRQVASPEALFARASGNIYVLEGLSEIAASSTVRRALAAGDRNITDIPDVVMDHIRQQQLYNTPIVNA